MAINRLEIPSLINVPQAQWSTLGDIGGIIGGIGQEARQRAALQRYIDTMTRQRDSAPLTAIGSASLPPTSMPVTGEAPLPSNRVQITEGAQSPFPYQSGIWGQPAGFVPSITDPRVRSRDRIAPFGPNYYAGTPPLFPGWPGPAAPGAAGTPLASIGAPPAATEQDAIRQRIASTRGMERLRALLDWRAAQPAPPDPYATLGGY